MWTTTSRALPILACLGLACGPRSSSVDTGTVSQAQDISPPVTLEVASESTGNPLVAVAVLRITAQVEVSGATLLVRTPRGVSADSARRALTLPPRRPIELRVTLQADRPGTYRVHFDIEARARGYETAGTSERRYLVADGRGPARIVTGHDLRREQRSAIADSLKRALATDPGADATLDGYLAGRVARPSGEAPADTTVQALAPPAAGIEPYDRVVDRSREVQRDLDPITVRARFFHRDRAGTLRPYVNATIDVRDSDTGPDEQLVSVVTDWDGRFTAVVNNDDGWFQNGRDIYVRIRAANSRFQTQDCSYSPDWTYAWETDVRSDLSDGTVVDFGSQELVDYGEAAILFQDLNQGWNYLTATGTQDPGFVDLCFPENASQYSTFWEEIDIEDGDEVARDIVLHEYGHATMHNAYGGDWPSNTGGAHGFDDVVHQNFAWTEGWATFIALAINPDGTYHSNGWSRAIEAFGHTTGHSAGDGPRNEGHVAAGMNDVRDAAAEGNCATGACDPSGANQAPMATIWRRAFWGSDADNIGEYWPRLCQELATTGQRNDAVRALGLNDIAVRNCVCVIRDLFLRAAGGDSVVRDLQEFRDLALQPTPSGRRIVDLYYRHSAEVAALALRDPELRAAAETLFRRAAGARRELESGKGDAVLLDQRHAELARTLIARLQRRGSAELVQDLELVKDLVDDFEGLRVDEVRAKLGREDRRAK
jgi:hypothetical protein